MRQDARLANLRLVSSTLKEMRQLTSANDDPLLAYLLDMAIVEADERAKALEQGPARQT
jgi:hypothetical protein